MLNWRIVYSRIPFSLFASPLFASLLLASPRLDHHLDPFLAVLLFFLATLDAVDGYCRVEEEVTTVAREVAADPASPLWHGLLNSCQVNLTVTEFDGVNHLGVGGAKHHVRGGGGACHLAAGGWGAGHPVHGDGGVSHHNAGGGGASHLAAGGGGAGHLVHGDGGATGSFILKVRK